MDDAEMRRQLEQQHFASYGWALSCCARDATQAEDVLQTVYLKVLDGRARYDGRAGHLGRLGAHTLRARQTALARVAEADGGKR